MSTYIANASGFEIKREQKEIMGIGDQCEYMNEVNWPGKLLKKGYNIEKLFTYIGDEEEKLSRIPGEVIDVLSGNLHHNQPTIFQ